MVIEAHVEETLREAVKPLHVEEIAKSSVVSPMKLGEPLCSLVPYLLLLMTSRESSASPSPPRSESYIQRGRGRRFYAQSSVFNARHWKERRSVERVSAIKCLLERVEVILVLFRRDPDNAYTQSGFYPALIAHFGAEGIRMSSFLTDTLFSPELSKSEAPGDAAIAQAYGVKDVFDYFGSNPRALKRFTAAMQGVGSLLSAEGESVLMGELCFRFFENDKFLTIATRGFGRLPLEGSASRFAGYRCRWRDWTAVPRNRLCRPSPELRSPRSQGSDRWGSSRRTCRLLWVAMTLLGSSNAESSLVTLQFWEKTASSELRARVELQTHDFFAPQPVRAAAVYVLRAVM